MYLWHFPLFIWIDGARTGLVGYQLFAVRLLATAVVATVSFYLLERPIRRGTFFRDWRAWVATPIAAVATIVVLVLATTVPAVADVKPVTPEPATARPKINVLVVGDSVALTLGIGIDAASLQKAFNFDEENKAEVGCGVAVGTLHRFKDQVGSSGASCQPNPSPGTQQWPQEWGGWISQYHPNVVVVLVGRWEVVDRTYDGQWTNILNPAYAAYVKQQLQLAVNVATSQGAGVVLMTAPCYDSGEQPNGQPWPEDSPARLNAYNDLVKQVVADNPGKATLFNLDALVCPGGRFEEYQGGVQIRNGDGIHFTWTGGIYLGPRIWPTIVGAARSLSPAGNRQSATGVTGPSTTAVPSTSAQATR